MIVENQFTQSIPPMPPVKQPCSDNTTGGYKKPDSPCLHPAADLDCKKEQNLNKQLNMKVKVYTLYLGSNSKRKHINNLIKELININNMLLSSLYTQGTTYYYSPSNQNLLYTHIDLYINNPVDIDFYDMEALVNIIRSSQIPVHTYCTGSIMGNALPIFLAGKRRYCYSTSRFKYDTALYWDEDHYWEFDRDKIEINQVRMNIDALIAQQACIKALELLQRNKYVYSDQAVAYNIVHEIIKINK